jgi:hypothetical protein
MSTFTLGLEDYTRNDEDLRQSQARQDLSDDMTALDLFAAHATASFSTRFAGTGTISVNQVGDLAGALNPSAYASGDRIITNVVAWAPLSGAGGVTTVDVQKQFDSLGGFASIFAGNNSSRVALSSSIGNNVVVSVTSFVSGTAPVWQAGKLLKPVVLSSTVPNGAGNGQAVVVDVLWKPSGSYTG